MINDKVVTLANAILWAKSRDRSYFCRNLLLDNIMSLPTDLSLSDRFKSLLIQYAGDRSNWGNEVFNHSAGVIVLSLELDDPNMPLLVTAVQVYDRLIITNEGIYIPYDTRKCKLLTIIPSVSKEESVGIIKPRVFKKSLIRSLLGRLNMSSNQTVKDF